MLIFRPAQKKDLAVLIKMLSDDQLGSLREDSSQPLDESYITAFQRIDDDPNNELVVLEIKKEIVGML